MPQAELTAYQKQQRAESKVYWLRIALSTNRVDKERAAAAIGAYRKAHGIDDVPEYVWCESPAECYQKLAAFDKMGMSIGRAVECSQYLLPDGNHRHASELDCLHALVSWFTSRDDLAPYQARVMGQYHAEANIPELFTTVGIPAMTGRVREIINDVIRETHFFLNFTNYVFHCERPLIIAVDDRNRLHSTTGPAILYGGNDAKECDHYIHGVRVDRKYIDDRKLITPAAIDGTRNIEVRRTLMEMYGVDRYLTNTGSQVISTGKYGKRLWWRSPENGSQEDQNVWRILRRMPEPLVMVEVINSTAEPDGSFKRYFLRVPPHVRDADEAVAWTFRLKKEEYHPDVET